MSGKPGPVYLDFPGDVQYRDIEEDTIVWPDPWSPEKRARPQANDADVASIVGLLEKAERPVIISGSGIQWGAAEGELQTFVEQAGIPFYTTPQSRGVIPEDHEFCYLTARSSAFREADLILVLATRMNYVIGNAAPPRFKRGRDAGQDRYRSDRNRHQPARRPRRRGGYQGRAEPVDFRVPRENHAAPLSELAGPPQRHQRQ